MPFDNIGNKFTLNTKIKKKYKKKSSLVVLQALSGDTALLLDAAGQ